jgi:CubicO group peptidase (beta-lactamase class C family)
MRKSYGFRAFRCLELALYHSLGKLHEPESKWRYSNAGYFVLGQVITRVSGKAVGRISE